MWNDLDRVTWAALRHNRGTAADVPDLLRRCRGRHPERVSDAMTELHDVLYHQGGWVSPAASAALPYLVDLATDRSGHHRDEIVELLVALVGAAEQAEPQFVDPGWAATWRSVAPRLSNLSTDPSPTVRRAATQLTRFLSPPAANC